MFEFGERTTGLIVGDMDGMRGEHIFATCTPVVNLERMLFFIPARVLFKKEKPLEVSSPSKKRERDLPIRVYRHRFATVEDDVVSRRSVR